ncbi:MAG: SusC/RagA family TonB-linked outer membrane protein [Bacteroidetes bacterium]|nr:SusC/RagA family TonB-linked outer membrane protein [Bacteroidota bacterium]
MRKKLLAGACTVLCILLIQSAFAQQKTVTGVVKQNNAPASAASVIVKGTTVGTRTDANGTFSFSVPANAKTLVISSVGFESQEVDIPVSGSIEVNLTILNNVLNEVVVTGYSSQRKKDITGAVSVVNVSDLKLQPTSDAQSQLQGRASGVTVIQNSIPGSPSNVRIRGLGSFNNNNPLYVVDGVQTGSISGINPNDIESLQVLKDAASASIYGVRASNGVIIVTTKKGKKKGVSVSYDMYYGSQNPGKGQPFLNAQEQAELLFLSRKNSGLAITGSVFGNGATPVLPDYIYYSGAANNGIPIMNGNPGVNPALYSLDYGRLGDPGYSPYIIVPTSKNGTDWYKESTQNAPIQSHNLSLSGAGENSRFMLSLNYFNQEAITKWQFFKRYTARLNSEFNVLPTVRVGENLQVFSSVANVGNTGQGEGSILAQVSRTHSIVPVYTIVPGDFAGTLGGAGSAFGTWGNGKNPVAQLYRAKDNRSNDINMFGNLYAEVDIAKHFMVRSSFGGAINTNNSYNYPFVEYEHTENNANTVYTENFIRNTQWIWTNQLSYKNTFGNHKIAALVGTEAQKGGGRQLIGAATTFYVYNYLPFINLNNGTVQNLGGSQTFTPGTTVSYFAKADYTYRDKFIASATIRRDGSSKFLGDNRWGNFPAFSLGWIASEEKFLKDVKWLNFLKVRGSWGKLGNEAAVSASNAYTTFGSNRQSSWYDLTGTQSAPLEGFFLSFVGNPLGKWEAAVTTNIGFDATIFKNTEIVFDWYQKKTEDLLYNPAGQAIGGAVVANNPAFRNVGSMKNSGIDLMITNRTNINRQIKLNTTLTLTTYKNEITKINGDQQFFDFNSPVNEANRIGSNATRNFVGSPLNTYYGYKVIGLFQTAAEAAAYNQPGAGPGRFKYEDINGDKKIDANDRTIIGNPNPDFTYGINLGAEYKAFDISMFFYGVSGKDAFNFTRWFTDFSSGFPGGRSKRALYESWLPDGSRPNATTPIQEATIAAAGFSTSGVVNSYYVENASYFRMRNLQLGYSLPSNLLSKVKISKARIYIQGTNLFTATKYSGLNPDIVSSDDRAASVDIGAYPTVRQFLVGANITF